VGVNVTKDQAIAALLPIVSSVAGMTQNVAGLPVDPLIDPALRQAAIDSANACNKAVNALAKNVFNLP
jgi:hypothetical protein